jgi:hypothetical protein
MILQAFAIVVDTRDRKTMVALETGDERLPPLKMKPLIPSELRPDAAICIPVHDDRAIIRLNRPDLKNCRHRCELLIERDHVNIISI